MNALSELQLDELDPLQVALDGAAGDLAEAPLLGLSDRLRICGGCGDAGAGSHAPAPDRRLGKFETEGDLIFFADAWSLGYMRADAHAPGMGRGLWAYYRDFDMLPPEVAEKNNPKQINGGDFDSSRVAVEQDGSTPLANTGRRVPTAWAAE